MNAHSVAESGDHDSEKQENITQSNIRRQINKVVVVSPVSARLMKDTGELTWHVSFEVHSVSVSVIMHVENNKHISPTNGSYHS